MEAGTVARVLKDVFTTTEGELSLRKGDILQVINCIDKYWCRCNAAGKIGTFPTDRLIAIETPPIADHEELFLATADFAGEQEGDMSFRNGEFIVAEEKLDEHWWRGRVYTRRGVFPDTYAWQLDSSHLKAKKKSDNLNLRARVTVSLRAQLDEEMDLRIGDIVTILEETEKGWYRGTCGNSSGIFPAAYVTIIDDHPPAYDDVTSHIRSDSSSGFSTNSFTNSSNNSMISASSSYSNIDSISGSHPTISSDLMTFSPEKEKRTVPPSLPPTDLSILQDDYFKLNMPSAFSMDSISSIGLQELGSYKEPHHKFSNMSYLTDLVSESDNCNIQPYGMTLYPFYAQYANELSFHENEIVHLIRYVDTDWLEGEIDGKRGIFPVSYINILVDCDKTGDVRLPGDSESFSENHATLQLLPHTFAKVMYNFDAQMNGDLSVKESEVVMIMEVVDTNWCKVRNKPGYVGLCPSNYLVPHSHSPSDKLFRSSSFSNTAPSLQSSSNSFLQTLHSSRRKYETHDFGNTARSSGGTEVENLISKNLSVLDSSKHVPRMPEDKLSIDFKDELLKKNERPKTEVIDSEASNEIRRCPSPPSFPPPQNPPPPPPQLIDSSIDSSLEEAVNLPPSSPPVLSASETSDLQDPNSPKATDEMDKCVNVDDTHHKSPSPTNIELRYPDKARNATYTQVRRSAPPVPGPPARPPPPVRRMSIDRSPHRPAPPVPVPGQTPVRRSLRRLPRQTSAPCVMAEEPTDVETLKKIMNNKEKQLQDLQMVNEEIEAELDKSSENDPRHVQLRQRGRSCDNQMRRLRLDIKHYKEALKKAESNPSNGVKDDCVLSHNSEERKKKMREQRQNVISELVMTEKEYVRDLKVTYEVYNLHNPAILEERGIDVKALFGNILDVMHVSEDLLDSLQRAMKGQSDEDQCIGPVFLQHAESMKKVYSDYCTNHEHALALLEKYKTMPEAQSVLEKGMETLRYQVTCFNVGSILIKPVQRLLKYPLILNELIKSTDDSHKDKCELLKAVKSFTAMASDINEYKRRKDIVSKYLGDGTSTLARRMAKLNLHSVAKKSSRLGAKLSSTLGLSMAPKDEAFLEQERIFHSLEPTVRSFLRNLEMLMNHMAEEVTALFHLGEVLAMFYMERNRDQDVDEFRTTQRLIVSQFWQEFKVVVERRVTAPLSSLLELFQGPNKLIDKRNDKLLDYDNCLARSDKNKESRQVQEELWMSKSNYEALNHQLLEELPKLIQLSLEMLVECLSAFVTARKLLSGKITKQYLNLIEIPALTSSAGDALEAFAVKHSLVCNQIGRFSFSSRTFRESVLKKSMKVSPTPARQLGTDGQKLCQSASQCAYLQGRYPPDKLYRTIQEHSSADPLDLSLSKGHLVGVIKKQDPMGSSVRWFVDNGVAHGFVRSSCLEIASALSVPTSPASSTGSCLTPSPNRLRPGSAASIRSYNSEHSPCPSLSPAMSEKSTPKPSPPAKPQTALPPSYEEVTGVSPTQHRYEEVPDDAIDTSGNCESNVYEEISIDTENPIYDEIPAHACYTDSSQDEEFYYSLYEFPGMGQHTLPLKNGQVVSVLQKRDLQGNSEWWYVENRFGSKGYVPANYLHPYVGEG